MPGYNPSALPSDHPNDVHIALGIYGLLDVDTIDSKITLRVALR